VLAVAVVFVVIQFVPVDRSNPPVTAEVPMKPAARAILRRACYDCHSHETAWPWYSNVAGYYLPVHRDAVLSAEDRSILREWARGTR
jgi:hypothetical protein